MAKPVIVACVNLKGGVGKTALAVNLSAYMALQGKKVLLVDMDPQTNATLSCITYAAWEAHAKSKGTVADLLGARKHLSATAKQKTAAQIVMKSVFPNVDLIPSHLDLFTVDLDMAGQTARETKLKKALGTFAASYDVVVCDCPPNLTIPTQNALAFSDFYVVPVSPDYLSALGIALLKNRVADFCTEIDHTTKLAGIVLSRVGRPAYHREEVVNTLKQQFGNEVLTQQLTERVQVSVCASQQISIFNGTDADAANEFRAVSKELMKRLNV